MNVLCPYHPDTLPSMAIYLNGAYCFGCGRTVDHATLAKRLGVTIRELLEGVKLTSPRTSSHYWMKWPSRRTDWKVPPSDFGPGYLISRGFSPEALASLGIEYQSGWVLFPLVVKPHARLRGPVSQMRKACEGGEYVSIGRSGPYGRVVIEPENPEGTIYVEGPLDAIWIWQHSERARRYRIAALCAPVRAVNDSVAIVWVDEDEGGNRYLKSFGKEVKVIRSGYEDPAATPPEVVERLMEEVLL